MTDSAILKGLNEKQYQAVTEKPGHMLLLAGAGSGKTRTLVSRIAWLIEHEHVSPHRIMAVTFTNKAAGEMKERLSHVLREPLVGLWVGTFHGLCHRLLRRHFREAQLPESFHILDSDDQLRLIKRVIQSLNLNEEQWPPKQAQAFINSNKDEGLKPGHVPHAHYGPSKTLKQIYEAYEQACQTAGVIDFAELLLRALELLRNNAELLAHYQARFAAILVDEFQDTNAVQYAWIRLLAGQNAFVMAVGDDDQSIYGWRGAKVENIQKFTHDFENAQVIRLEQNYRSTATILDAANALIRHNQARMGKNLWTKGNKGEKIVVYSAFNELDEARFVSERIAMAHREGYALSDMAVLYRSNAQSRVLEEALLRAGSAYRIYGGVRYFERSEIKDALAYLRLMANEDDDSAFERVVNFPTRGIGEKTLEEVRQHARLHARSLWWASCDLIEQKRLASRAGSHLNAFLSLIRTLQKQCQDVSLDEQISTLLQMSGLYAHFEKQKGEKSESRLDNLQELINAARQFRYERTEEDELPMLTAFLAYASLEAGDMQAKAHEQDFVHMMTLHAAKGLEFPVVFLVGLEEGIFPGRQSIAEPHRLEEERRLCYVGMTRAMQRLFLSYAEVRRLYGREEYHRPSRFLRELPIDYLEQIRVSTSYQAPSQMTHSRQTSSSHHAAEQAGLQLSQTVKHEKFGVGVVLAVEGSGAHTRVQVNFSDSGCKWLVLAYANLTLL